MFKLTYLVMSFFILQTLAFNANAYCPFNELNRTFIKELPEGFLVQDFYKTGEKYTSPFLLKDKQQALMKEVSFNECFGYDDNMSIEGNYVTWTKRGDKVMEGHYKNGKKQGLFTTWQGNNIKENEVLYIDDQKEGLYTQWFPNGDKYIEENYKSGKLNGKRTEWFRGNIKKLEVSYKNGQLDGESSHWCQGKRYTVTIYKEGKEVSTKNFFTKENADENCKTFTE